MTRIAHLAKLTDQSSYHNRHHRHCLGHPQFGRKELEEEDCDERNLGGAWLC